MRMRLLAALALTAAVAASPAAAADDAKLPDVKAFDKAVIDALRAVHNKGADLYNTGSDYAGAYRLYQGALESVRPLLAHRPGAQKLIDSGLAAAAKEADADRKAYVLHETIEGVRKQLKVANGFENPAGKKPEEKKAPDNVPEKKSVEKKPEEKKPVEKKPEVKAPEKKVPEKKPVDKKDISPMPKAKGSGGSVAGKVTVAGKPLAAGELTLVSVNLPAPRVFSAPVKGGAFKLDGLPAGRYRAVVTGDGVPAKYHLVGTSELVLEVASGAATADLDLK